MGRLEIKGELFRWARERAGLDEVAMAKKIGVKAEKIEEWENNQKEPTFNQAQKWAEKTYVPFADLFLPKPPEEKLPISDFRMVGGKTPKPTPNLLDTIYNAQYKQDWYREYLIENNNGALSFLLESDYRNYKETAIAINNILSINELRQQSRNYEDFLRKSIEKAREVGLLIMRSGIVENNTHRPLEEPKTGGFRGIALSDDYAPLIFINGKDSLSAQIFTLMHEIAHIWRKDSGVSNPWSRDLSGNSTEVICNKIAAEILAPEREFRQQWKQAGGSKGDKIEATRRYFKVSALVIARRALDMSFINNDDYETVGKKLEEWGNKRTESSGGDYYLTMRMRIPGAKFSRAVIATAKEGRIKYTDAYGLLNLSRYTFDKYAKILGF